MPVDSPSPLFLATVTPVVLAGGLSTRFGRDKLREPMEGGGVLIQRPIAALRAVFGPRTLLVGPHCDAVAALGDAVIPDEQPGQGPLGGIISALAHRGAGGPIMVLAGDMAGVLPQDVLELLTRAEPALAQGALAVLAQTDRPHPCFGLYAPAALPLLRARQAAGELRMRDALPPARTVTVRCRTGAAANINRVTDLRP